MSEAPNGLQPCPECLQGKCLNCDGTTWDVVADMPSPCPCDNHVHNPSRDCPTCSPELHLGCPPGEIAHRYCLPPNHLVQEEWVDGRLVNPAIPGVCVHHVGIYGGLWCGACNDASPTRKAMPGLGALISTRIPDRDANTDH